MCVCCCCSWKSTNFAPIVVCAAGSVGRVTLLLFRSCSLSLSAGSHMRTHRPEKLRNPSRTINKQLPCIAHCRRIPGGKMFREINIYKSGGGAALVCINKFTSIKQRAVLFIVTQGAQRSTHTLSGDLSRHERYITAAASHTPTNIHIYMHYILRWISLSAARTSLTSQYQCVEVTLASAAQTHYRNFL